MKAVCLYSPSAIEFNPLEFKELPIPQPGPDQVRIKISACGVCHTDLHLAEGLFKTAGYDPFPLIPGHEIAGVAETWADGVTGFHQGDRVAVYWWHSCGRCRYCQAGEEESCLEGLAQMRATGLTRHGGYAPWVSVPADCLAQV